MTYTLLFDQDRSSSNNYTEDIKMDFDLTKRSEQDLRREWSETTTSNPEDNLQFSIAKRKKGVINLQGSLYFNGVDKSGGTIQKAVNNGDLTLSDFNNDDRLESHIVQSVSTNDDTFTVSGDKTRRVDLDSTIVVFNSTGNDGIYNPTDKSYNSGSDQTTITVNENVTDSTADGTIQTGVHTLDEQMAWLEDYVWVNVGAPFHVIKASRFNDDGVEDGKKVVVENCLTSKNAGRVTGDFNLTLRLGEPI